MNGTQSIKSEQNLQNLHSQSIAASVHNQNAQTNLDELSKHMGE